LQAEKFVDNARLQSGEVGFVSFVQREAEIVARMKVMEAEEQKATENAALKVKNVREEAENFVDNAREERLLSGEDGFFSQFSDAQREVEILARMEAVEAAAKAAAKAAAEAVEPDAVEPDAVEPDAVEPEEQRAEIGQAETKLHVRWPSCMEWQRSAPADCDRVEELASSSAEYVTSEKATAGDSSARRLRVSWPALPEYERDFGAELMAKSSAEQPAEQGAEQAARLKAGGNAQKAETKLHARGFSCMERQRSAPAVGTTSSASGCYTSSGSDDN
jgi:hypothetical protein